MKKTTHHKEMPMNNKNKIEMRYLSKKEATLIRVLSVLLTLLLTFFIACTSTATNEKDKAEVVSESTLLKAENQTKKIGVIAGEYNRVTAKVGSYYLLFEHFGGPQVRLLYPEDIKKEDIKAFLYENQGNLKDILGDAWFYFPSDGFAVIVFPQDVDEAFLKSLISRLSMCSSTLPVSIVEKTEENMADKLHENDIISEIENEKSIEIEETIVAEDAVEIVEIQVEEQSIESLEPVIIAEEEEAAEVFLQDEAEADREIQIVEELPPVIEPVVILVEESPVDINEETVIDFKEQGQEPEQTAIEAEESSVQKTELVIVLETSGPEIFVGSIEELISLYDLEEVKPFEAEIVKEVVVVTPDVPVSETEKEEKSLKGNLKVIIRTINEKLDKAEKKVDSFFYPYLYPLMGEKYSVFVYFCCLCLIPVCIVIIVFILLAAKRKKLKANESKKSSEEELEAEGADNNEIDSQEEEVVSEEDENEDIAQPVEEENSNQVPEEENNAEDVKTESEEPIQEPKIKRERNLDVDILSYGINLYKTLSIREVKLANQLDSLDDEIRLLYNKIKRLARVVPKTDGNEKEALVKELESCREERNEKLKLRENLYIYSFEVAKAKNEYVKEIEEI